MRKKLFFVVFILSILTNINFVYADTYNVQINDLRQKIGDLEKENAELKKSFESFDKEEIIKTFESNENSLISSADNAINRINIWIAVFSIGITLFIAIGSISTYVLQKYRFDKIEKELEKYKNDIEKSQFELHISREDLKLAKSELEIAKDEFISVKTESQAAALCATDTQNLVNQQYDTIQSNYNNIKNGLENIREEVRKLAEKAKESEGKAKTSENKSKASEYINQALAIVEDNDQAYNQRIELYTKALELNPTSTICYNNRGVAFSRLGRKSILKPNSERIKYLQSAVNDYSKAIEISRNENDKNGIMKYIKNRIVAYDHLGLLLDKSYFKSSFNDIDELFKLSDNYAESYNIKAMTYRLSGEIDNALETVNKSLEFNNEYGYAYSTKAEIYAELKKDEEFFYFTELALKHGCTVWDYIDEDLIYQKYKDTQRFKDLIGKYKK